MKYRIKTRPKETWWYYNSFITYRVQVRILGIWFNRGGIWYTENDAIKHINSLRKVY